jgi:hypothetical protein
MLALQCHLWTPLKVTLKWERYEDRLSKCDDLQDKVEEQKEMFSLL